MISQPGVTILSNRGPITFVEEDGGFGRKRGAGGLAGALDPVARNVGYRALWIAAATSSADRKAIASDAVGAAEKELGYRLRLLDIDPKVYRAYYDEVSNRMLWFANHCLWDEVDVRSFSKIELAAWDAAYEPVNERFARTAAEETAARSLVLFQDYHLATAPSYLRELRDDQTILHFTHSSFCDPAGIEPLPERIRHRVISGMLASDLVGFHVARWAENFLACCESIGGTVDESARRVDFAGRSVWVRNYPIPIDPEDIRRRAAEKPARVWAKRFREWAGDAQLIARADRTEPSKNIVRGFEAFERLLERRSDLIGNVRFAACVYPSRQGLPEYQTYARRIEECVARINEKYPDSIALFGEDDYDRSLGALMASDVLLVNPIMDGMNLVSKEGPAINEHDGVLVLARGAGSFDELGPYSVPIDDPLDVELTATAIETALELPAGERRGRADELRARATSRTPADWIRAQIQDLNAIRDGEQPR